MLRERKKVATGEWIFPHPLKPEEPTHPRSAYSRLKKILREAGLPDIRFHDPRHTFATMSLEHGMDIKTLSAVLGHVSAGTTLDVYSHVSNQMQRQAAEKIEQGIGGGEAFEAPVSAPSGTAGNVPAPGKERVKMSGDGTG